MLDSSAQLTFSTADIKSDIIAVWLHSSGCLRLAIDDYAKDGGTRKGLTSTWSFAALAFVFINL